MRSYFFKLDCLKHYVDHTDKFLNLPSLNFTSTSSYYVIAAKIPDISDNAHIITVETKVE